MTPPSSSRSSPRLEPPSRSNRLPSPPTSRRESILYGQPALERAQADYLSQLNGQAAGQIIIMTQLDEQASLQVL